MSVAVIYRSQQLADCEQRSFLLYAVGIGSEVVRDAEGYVLVVPEENRSAAIEELKRHEAEARASSAPAPAPLPLHAHAWLGVFAYAFTIVFIAWCAGERLFGADWYAAGALRPDVLHTLDWPRLVTALTLHGDVAHLIANLAFGVFFGYFAGQLLGAGVAWLSVLTGAVLGNFLDSLVMPPGASSIGASTAVFATLGLVAAHSWRQRANTRLRWAYRYAPLIAGVALLAFTGAGGQNTDVVAHATGFLCGGVVGALHAWRPSRSLFDWRLQVASGVLTFSAIIGAWTAALR